MNYVSDDVDVEMMGFMNDPLVSRQLYGMASNAGMYGIDLNNPEVMQGFIQDLGKKIKSLITGGAKIAITTPKGTISTGGGQLEVTTGQMVPVPANIPVTVPPSPIIPGGIGDLLKNPWIVGGLIGIPVLLLIMAKKKKEREE